jgi:hypothetical protein
MAATFSSTNVFHSPHSGQRPSHFGDCAPHDVHAKTTLEGFIGERSQKSEYRIKKGADRPGQRASRQRERSAENRHTFTKNSGFSVETHAGKSFHRMARNSRAVSATPATGTEPT